MALALPAAPADAQECRLDFTVEVTQGAGDIRPGRILSGQATFRTSGQDFRGEAGITVHLATGDMTIDTGIRGDIWAIVTTSGNPVADLLAVHARNVEGFTVAGLRYAGPMTITLYAHPGSLPGTDVPTAQAAWDAMDLSRRFALHAQGYDRVAGDVTGLGVACN
ncbi:MAG: hypothetical protein HLUCCO18_02135 [Rhodobacteraceae bacterium HLUCCO18]|nr:MAG: hypothetical protein HLUCCO18_02135 [Rhodobacteraceae bacterium HLUCCO18]